MDIIPRSAEHSRDYRIPIGPVGRDPSQRVMFSHKFMMSYVLVTETDPDGCLSSLFFFPEKNQKVKLYFRKRKFGPDIGSCVIVYFYVDLDKRTLSNI